MRTDGRTDVTQIIAAFRNFAKALKTVLTFVISSSPTSYLLSTILSLLPYALFILHIVFINLFLLNDPSIFFRVFLVASSFSNTAVPILFASRNTFQVRNSSRSTIVTLIPKARMCIFGCF